MEIIIDHSPIRYQAPVDGGFSTHVTAGWLRPGHWPAAVRSAITIQSLYPQSHTKSPRLLVFSCQYSWTTFWLVPVAACASKQQCLVFRVVWDGTWWPSGRMPVIWCFCSSTMGVRWGVLVADFSGGCSAQLATMGPAASTRYGPQSLRRDIMAWIMNPIINWCAMT